MRSLHVRLRLALVSIVLGCALPAPGCGREEAAPKQSAAKPAAPAAPAAQAGPSEAARAEAAALYTAKCADCHGVRGAANGPRSRELSPPPRNFQDPDWQRSVKDAYLEQIIVQGGAAVGKSDVMPATPELADKPEVVTALRIYLRRFAN